MTLVQSTSIHAYQKLQRHKRRLLGKCAWQTMLHFAFLQSTWINSKLLDLYDSKSRLSIASVLLAAQSYCKRGKWSGACKAIHRLMKA